MTRRLAVLCLVVFWMTGVAGGQDLSSVPRIKLEELRKLMAASGVVVVDVRDIDTYRDGHIPGAISMPLETVAARGGALKQARKPIVAYCS